MNNDNNKKATKLIVWGFILMFTGFFSMIGFIFIIIGITMLKNNKNNTTDFKKDDISQEEIHAHDFIEVQKDDISQEEVHAHDFTQVEQDDITQEQVHAHDSWNNDGPIKYY